MDERQTDIFGAILPAPTAAEPQLSPTRQPRGEQDKKRTSPAQDNQNIPTETDIDALAIRLSPAELDQLAAALTDDGLARLVLATTRQLRRRLARTSRWNKNSGKGRASSLERAARQLAAELGGTVGDDHT